MRSATRHYVLAAGGTGGHVLPAYAVAQELLSRGHRVALLTDERGQKIPGAPADLKVHILSAGRVDLSPLRLFGSMRSIMRGRREARVIMQRMRPAAVAGFGGYPSIPGLLAARAESIPMLIHEQNAVLGRTNRMFARQVAAIAVAYNDVQRIPDRVRDRVHVVGNPVRAEVVALRDEPYPPLGPDSIFRILIVGGSLGASVLSKVVPTAITMLPPALQSRLQIVQQARADDLEAVRAAYAALSIPAELSTFITDFPERLRWAHLVIARAGASTVAELACAGRPAIFVPYPGAMDDHQRYNVSDMVAAGGARSILQEDFTPTALAKQIQRMALEPGALETAAARARTCGLPNATRDLADLIESAGGAPLMDVIRVGAASGARGSTVRASATSRRDGGHHRAQDDKGGSA